MEKIDEAGSTLYFMMSSNGVVHETIEGETIIVNLNMGTYYSLNASASAVWSHLNERALSLGEIVNLAISSFDVSEQIAERDVNCFLGELINEGLIQSIMNPASDSSCLQIQGNRLKYTPPILQKYTDLEELLLIDPIHEISESWPNANKGE